MSPEEAELAEAEELLRAAEEKGGRPWPRGVTGSMAGASLEVWGCVSSRFGVSPHHQRVLYSFRGTMVALKESLKVQSYFFEFSDIFQGGFSCVGWCS